MAVIELESGPKVKINNLVDTIQSVKRGISAGAGATTASATADVAKAQYPAARSSGIDSNAGSDAPLYSNGMLFKAYHYESRTSVDLAGQRTKQQTNSMISAIKAAIGRSDSSASTSNGRIEKNLVCNILMPRSKSDVDQISHKFNDVNDSLLTKGGGSITGALSNVASTAVFGAIESVTQGLFADNGEQIFNASRSMYAGADNRTKVFTWDLIPRTVEDLIEILRIYEYFSYFSYGVTGNSSYSKKIKAEIDSFYKNTFLKSVTPEGADLSDTFMESITEFLSNVIVVSNPTIWFVRNYGESETLDTKEDIFGPAQIQSIRFDKSPDGQFNPLQVAPNLPSAFQLEITMREIIQLNRKTFMNGDIT